MPIRGSRCPPGVFCITPGFMLILGVVLIAVGLLAYHGGLLWKAATTMSAPQPQAQAQPQPQPQPPITIQVTSEGGGDDRYTRAPKPERHWMTEPEMPTRAEIYGKLPRMPTRGLPETYQSMGVITLEDGAVLPLYGRRTAARSDRFQYYTRTDSYNPVQLPLQYKRRDCQDDVGCEELFDGEAVKVAATNQSGKVTVYRFDGPTYVPGIL